VPGTEVAAHVLALMGAARGVLWQDSRGAVGHCDTVTCEQHANAIAPSSMFDGAASILLIESGNLCIEQAEGMACTFGAGAMLMCFGGLPLRGHWDRARFGYVRPSQQRLAQVLGREPGDVARGIEPLQHGLTPFLGAQFGMLKSHGAMLAPADRKHVIDSIFQTAEAILKTALMPVPEPANAQVREKLDAVHRFIEGNLHRQELSVPDIALGSHISRSNLYRLFDGQAYSVHGTLREQRLQRGWRYLHRAESDRLSIGAIAHACGFSDQSVFSKLFRQRFGITPRQARSLPPAQEPQH
jgi:AraC-like DNA-binding protein